MSDNLGAERKVIIPFTKEYMHYMNQDIFVGSRLERNVRAITLLGIAIAVGGFIMTLINIAQQKGVLNVADDVQVVGIDEAQFYDMSLVDVAQELADRGKRVIIAGLDTDYLGKPFGPMPYLMAVAEEVRKVHAICVRCGNLANHSHRLSNSMELVVLGEKDAYEPLCRDCYNKVMAEEAARKNVSD